jgi:hypothetical protein
MNETRPRDLPEYAARILRQHFGQLGTPLLIERASGIKVIGTVEDAPHHIPFGEAEGVVSHCVEHPPVRLPLRPCARRAGGSMLQARRSRGDGCPLSESFWRCVPQCVVQPHRAQPPVALGIRHSHPLRPIRRQFGHALDVAQPLRCDDGPLRQSGPQSGRRVTRRGFRTCLFQISARSGGRMIRFFGSTNTTRGECRSASSSE